MPEQRSGNRWADLRPGFTLMELLIVLVILAIIIAVALPQYTRTLEQQRCREAQDALLTIYAGERVYASVYNDKYYSVGTWSTIYMDNPTPPDNAIAYTVAANNGGATAKFTATAKRTGGSKANSTLKIDETRTITSSGDACPFDG